MVPLNGTVSENKVNYRTGRLNLMGSNMLLRMGSLSEGK